MENSKNQVNKNKKHEVLPSKILSESDLHSGQRSINKNTDSEFRIIGLKVLADDNQVYSFTLGKARSKSADVLSILSGPDDIYSQKTVRNCRSLSEAEKYSLEIPYVNPKTFFKEHALNSESIENGKEYGANSLLKSTHLPIKKTSQRDNEASRHFINVPSALVTNQDKILTVTQSEDGLDVIPALELKISSTCIEKKDFEIHIKSKNENVLLSSLNEEQHSNIVLCKNHQSVDDIKIDPPSVKPHDVLHESPDVSCHITDMTSKEALTERQTTTDVNQTINLEVVKSNSLQNTDESENAHPSINEIIKSTEPESKNFITNQAAAETKKETTSVSSQTESTLSTSIEKEREASSQTENMENIETSVDLQADLPGRKNVGETSLTTENFSNAPVMVDKAKKVKAEENEIEENCQCSCGHKKHHDCIYKCCYHRDSDNMISTSIMFGESLRYLASMCNTLKCDYCHCRLNRSCSESTSNCTEKLTSNIHPQYCCKCKLETKNMKNTSTSMTQTEKPGSPKTIQLKSEIFSSLPLNNKVLHQPKVEIKGSLEQLNEKEQNNIAVKISRFPETEKGRSLDLPLIIEHCLNSYLLKKIERSRAVINPIDIKLSEKIISEKKSEEQLKPDVKSLKNKSDTGGKKKSNQPTSSATEKKLFLNKSKLDSYYSHSSVCPCSVCHKNKETVPEKGENNILLMNSCGVYLRLKESSANKTFRSTSPRIEAENFDYITKDGWKPHDRRSDECLNKKRYLSEFTYLEEISGEECFESVTEGLDEASQLVNDHLLNFRPIEESYYSKQQLQKAAEILHKRWFAVIGSKFSDVFEVRNLIRYFKDLSNSLLKALLHSVDNNGNNVLHFAFANNKFDVVDELLKSGFALELLRKENKSGNTPLMICAISQPKESSDWSIVRRCFEFSDVNEKSSTTGQTPLMNAASCGFQIMVDLLLDIGANPNLQDKDGSTALMYAAEHGHEKCVKSLVRHKKCDPTIRDKDGETACSIALSNGHKNIAVLIHMQALQKRRFIQNLHSTKRYIWTNSNKTASGKSIAMMPISISNFDLSFENY